jgi:hypothetical protein
MDTIGTMLFSEDVLWRDTRDAEPLTTLVSSLNIESVDAPSPIKFWRLGIATTF